MRRRGPVIFFGIGAIACAIAVACIPHYEFGSGAGDGGLIGDGGDTDGASDGGARLDATFDPAQMARLDPAANGRFNFRIQRTSGGDVQLSAALTHSFAIDRTEVSVARFRKWLDGAHAKPDDGASLDPGGPYEQVMRWRKDWNSQLSLQCMQGPASYGAPSTLSRDSGTLPVSCVNWFDAAAFCASEGLRLPSELEWQYTVTSGGERFFWPWVDTLTTTLDCDHVIFDFGALGRDGGGCGFPDAGPAEAGATVQGVLDLSGRLFEWVWDVGDDFPFDAGEGYAGPLGDGSVDLPRVRRGGSFNTQETDSHLMNFYRDPTFSGSEPYDDLGFRCAKSL